MHILRAIFERFCLATGDQSSDHHRFRVGHFCLKKGDAGHCPRNARAIHVFEVEVQNDPLSKISPLKCHHYQHIVEEYTEGMHSKKEEVFIVLMYLKLNSQAYDDYEKF